MQGKQGKNTEISARISKLLEALDVNPNAFALAIGYKRAQTVYDAISGKSAPGFDFFNKLAMSEYSAIINLDWLLTGRGEIFRQGNSENSEGHQDAEKNIFLTKTPKKAYNSNVGENVGLNVGLPKLQKRPTFASYPTTEDIPEMQVADVVPVHRFPLRPDRAMEEQQVPVYDSLTLHSLDKLFSNNIEPSSYISIPNLPKCDGAVRMWGDKMSPELKGGDLLVYKKVKDLRSGLFLGQIYLISVEIEGEEYVMVQYLEASECENSVKLVSKNERYPPKDIPLKSIKALAMIKASVRYQPI